MNANAPENTHSFETQAWLSDPRWTSNTFHAEQGKYWLTLKTMPAVIGGNATGYIDGLQPQFHGKAQVTITCTVVKSSRNHDRTPSATMVTEFMEVETIDVSGPRVDFSFLIPFETPSVSDGADWTLMVEFENGVAELFQIPVYRTADSDPALSTVKIASVNSAGITDTPARSETKPSYSLTINDKLRLEIPLRVSGKPSLATGLGIFFGLWAAVSVVIILVAGVKDGPWFFFIPLPVMAFILLFLIKGTTVIEVDDKMLSIKHRLFGVGIPSRINREEVEGFSTKCFGSLPSDTGPQASYTLAYKRSGVASKMLTPALLSQWDSRLLIKRINEYWDLKP